MDYDINFTTPEVLIRTTRFSRKLQNKKKAKTFEYKLYTTS